MKTTLATVTIMVLALATGGNADAQDEGRTALEESNLKQAVYCMEILENSPEMEAAHRIQILRDECYSEDFIEHAPNIEGGREALLRIFESRYEKYPELSMSIKRTASDGDLVWIHLHVKHTPESLGAAGVHIFRMAEGKIVEHWGVNQPVPENPKNSNSMF